MNLTTKRPAFHNIEMFDLHRRYQQQLTEIQQQMFREQQRQIQNLMLQIEQQCLQRQQQQYTHIYI